MAQSVSHGLDRTLAIVFGQRAIQLIRDGREPATAARLAASYAFRARPDLRITTGLWPTHRPVIGAIEPVEVRS